MKTLALFTILTIINVVIQTAKCIVTIRCGKFMSALTNAIAYGLYTFVIVYTVSDINIWVKAGITAFANLVGVYLVKLIEEKMKKDKIWEVRVTVRPQVYEKLEKNLSTYSIPYSVLKTADESHYIVNIYCSTQAESDSVKGILSMYPTAKYFISETKSF